MHTNPIPPVSLRRLLAIIFTGTAGFAASLTGQISQSLQGVETRTFIQLLEQAHYERSNVKQTDYPKLIPLYMAALDRQRRVFLATDQEQITSNLGKGLYWNLATLGQLSAEELIFRRYVTRAEARIDWILKKLSQDFDLTDEETYDPDRISRTWAATETEADELWRKHLESELIEEILAGKSLDAAKATLLGKYESQRKALPDAVAPHERMEMFLTAVAHLYDSQSSYYAGRNDPADRPGLNHDSVGIGLELTMEDGHCRVSSVIPGGPAAYSGEFSTGDRLIKVAEKGYPAVDISWLTLPQVTRLTAGPTGSSLELTIQPAASSQRKKITLTRQKIDPNAAGIHAALVEQTVDDQALKLGVVKVDSLYGSEDGGNTVSQDTAALLVQLTRLEAKGVVLDLRNNGGGLLKEAIEIAALFIGKEPVAQTKNYTGEVTIEHSSQPAHQFKGPLVILVDRKTASGAEIVAGALQRHGRGIVVGSSNTAGIGRVQAVLEMRALVPALSRVNEPTGVAKLTVQQLYLSDGTSIESQGVKPDILVMAHAATSTDQKTDERRAAPADKIKASKIGGKPLAPVFLTRLQKESEARQSASLAFTQLRLAQERENQLLAERHSLNLERRRQLEKQLQTQPPAKTAWQNDQKIRPIEINGPNEPEAAKPQPIIGPSDLNLQESLNILIDLLRP